MDTKLSRPAFARRPGASSFALVALCGLAACKEDSAKPDAGTNPDDVVATTRAAVLSSTAACVLQTSREFLVAATALEEATLDLETQPDTASLEAARAAYHQAMDAWQVAEVMQVGPAAPRSATGGMDYRDNIYSWPLVSRCAIEEQIVNKGYEAAGFPHTLVSRRGLYALEYLLFYTGTDTACPASSPIVSGGTWAALSTEELAARKRAYAKVAARDVRLRASNLVGVWEPQGGNFTQTLQTAGSGNALFATSQAALNSVSDALFYYEISVKDMKLARPLGLRDCTNSTCPELLESSFAGRSKANVRANLVGFRRIAEGCGADYAGTGFDDLLAASGAEDHAVNFRARMAAAEDALELISEPDLAEALAQDKASVRAYYDAVKGVTDILKVELVTVLDLELPQSVEGDND